jgi:hypothetical protein
MVALAAGRVAAGLVLYAAGLSPDPNLRPIPLWVFATLSAIFTLMAVGLVLGHKDDPRAAWLGGTLALVGGPLALPLVPLHGPASWLSHVRPDAFLGAFVWQFLACFPSELRGPRAGVVRGIAAAGAMVGVVLAAASLATLWAPDGGPVLARLLPISVRPSVYYWPMLLAVSVPAFVGLAWRALTAEGADRSRLALFGMALLVGLAPFALEVLLEGLWPAYAELAHGPTMEPVVGAVLFATLATLPLTTAYSVLFDRVVSVRLVLHAALQYGLARYTILALTLIPFGGLVLVAAQHRDESLVRLFTGGSRAAVLGVLALLGVVALLARPRVLAALDRRYFREPYDAAQVLGRLMKRPAQGTAELGARVSEEVGQALHARVHVMLMDETGSVLGDSEGRLPALSALTPLLALADAADQLLDLGAPDMQPALARLPEHERRWLATGGFSLVAPIRSHELGPVGLIALAPKRSEMPYTFEDRRFVSTVASAAGLALDRLQARSAAAAPHAEALARECAACGTVYAPEARVCLCGGTLADAPVPHVLRGVFRFEQRIASGAEGVVYRAVDLGLGRNGAIKTLPGVTRQRSAALVAEARAMARVTHPNLAVVHGVEMWRDVTFLVQEYLDAGTLALRLSRHGAEVLDAIDLGILLAGLLDHMHRHDLVHRDIKPSNIGYTAGGVVKLFDFGLAHRASPSTTPGAEASAVVGTPYYMSPEAVRGHEPSPLVDLWALAVVLYEAIAGRRPFDGATSAEVLGAILRGTPARLVEIRPATPEPVSAWFEAALAPDPSRRPASAADVRDGLSALRAALVAASRGPSPDSPAAPEVH